MKDGFSIRAQNEKLRDYVRIKDWELYKVYADEGISGKNIKDRPALNEMIKDIKGGYVKNVLVFKVDRLTRSTRDLIDLIEMFNTSGCAFNSLTESIDTLTPSGRMFLKIIGIFAEFERENIIERVKLGFEKKVSEGYSLCSRTASYGYVRPSGQRIQIIEPEEARVVLEIFDMFMKCGMTCYGIAEELNRRGVKTKEDSVWTGKTIKLILTNSNYIGKVRHRINDTEGFREKEGRHEAIIDRELFERTQAKIAKLEKKTVTKRPKEAHYFSGALICGLCGRKMTAHGCYRKNKDSERYIAQYRCVNKTRNECAAKDVSHMKLEDAFQDYMSRTGFGTDWKSLAEAEKMRFVQENVERIIVINEPEKNKVHGKVRILQVDLLKEKG